MDIEQLKKDQLIWLPELGIGYYEVEDTPYDEDYFKKYQSYEGTDFCDELNRARVDMVKKYYQGRVLDIGIGSGSFIIAHGNCDGYDINPAGVNWLKERGLYLQPVKEVEAVTFWDSFEHIRDPNDVLQYVTDWVFMSIPLFDGCNHVLKSKHYRKDEHYWYFTINGLVTYMKLHGFGFVGFNCVESDIGREDIGSFVFKRASK
jgi:SAM-dependent methyltransferase